MPTVKKTTQVVSVDFDYWIPEDPMLDLGHQETNLFVGILWGIRLSTHPGLEDELVLSPDETPPYSLGMFLKQRGLRIASNPSDSRAALAVAESHASILDFLDDLHDLELFHLDAHHDFGYGDRTDDCGSWVKSLVNAGRVRCIRLFYPTWRKQKQYDVDWREETAKTVEEWKTKGVDVHVEFGLDEFPKDVAARKVFLCRSGAWSPPWTDRDFCMMVGSFMMTQGQSTYTCYTHSSLEEFERPLDWDAINQAREQFQAHREQIGANG